MLITAFSAFIAKSSWANLLHHKLIEVNQSIAEPENSNLAFSNLVNEIPNFLSVGQLFNLEEIENKFKETFTNQNTLSEIPFWLYGTWEGTTQTQDFHFNYASQKSSYNLIKLQLESYDVIGDIKASDGRIFSIVMPNLIGLVGVNNKAREYQLILWEKREIKGFQKFSTHDLAIRIQVDPISEKILHIYQLESIKIYTPNFQTHKIITQGWLKSFDITGNPVSLSHSIIEKSLLKKHELVNLAEIKKLPLGGNNENKFDF